MRELEYPFDGELILMKSKKMKRALLEERSDFTEKRIAVLGGSTTHDIIRILELFLLEQGIRPVFYESEYAQYWQDVMFDNPELISFAPDLIFIHTSNRNIAVWPAVSDPRERVDELLSEQFSHFQMMWEKIAEVYHCPVVQNNFEYPFYRLLGNQEGVYPQGRISFINRLNEKFYQYAREHGNFYIHDINYLSASYGLDRWADPLYWHMYKYACCMQAIPAFAHNLANIVKSVFGRNKKALVLDLRGNPGGLLDAVVDIGRQILPEGLVVYTEDKNGKRVEYDCDGTRKIEIPMVVLVNGGSASAAEVLTGAVKDYGVGTIMGTTTYGKGIVQKIIELSDGSAIKLTTDGYFTPKGNNIHGKGIEPDIVVEFDAEAYYGEEQIDNQLEAAQEYLKKRLHE